MNSSQPHILLAEDDLSLGMVLGEYLGSKGYEVHTRYSGQEAHDELLRVPYDCCVLGGGLSRPGALNILSAVRSAGKDMPVFVLLNYNDREQILRAYELGADDVIVKPFSVEILLCKIAAVMRRYQVSQQSNEVVFDLGGKTFDSIQQTLDGVHLSGRESDLLLLLCRNQNQVVDRHLILRSLWQQDNYFASRSLSVYANHLRARLVGTGYELRAIHGKGYKLINTCL